LLYLYICIFDLWLAGSALLLSCPRNDPISVLPSNCSALLAPRCLQVDFAHYRSVLKNQKVVDELENTFKSFKPVDYDVSAQLKAIDQFQAKAVSTFAGSYIRTAC